MIREIAKEIAAVLETRLCPIQVIADGPEATQTNTFARERIVFEHDDQAGDTFVAPAGSFVNPVPVAIRNIGAKVTVYAQSPYVGAKTFEHVRRAEHAVDMIVAAMKDVAAARKNQYRITGGRFIRPVDLDGSPTFGGAVYEMTFTWERGIRVLTWDGDKRPETTVDGGIDGISIANETHVSINGSDDFEIIP